MPLLTPASIAAIFRRFSALDSAPRTELDYKNEFTLLVSIVLSAQATDKSVNLATPPLFALADNPAKMAKLGEEKIKSFIRSIGLYNMKAKNVAALSRMLVEQHGGLIPHDYDALKALPGVGSKTAKVWLNNALGLPVIAVDTHVFRVANRLGLCHTKTADATEIALEKIIPARWRLNAHHWLILHGRYICKARLPECWHCPVVKWCLYEDKMLVPPVKKKTSSA